MEQAPYHRTLRHISFALLLSFCSACAGVYSAEAAIVAVAPSPVEVKVGERLPLEIWLETEGVTVNAVDLRFSFQPAVLQSESVDFGNSILTLFPEPASIAGEGQVHIIAGTPNGFSGRVPLARIFVRAVRAGEAVLTLDPSSRLYLNSGDGASIRPKVVSGFFHVNPSLAASFSLHSPTDPDEGVWYPEKDVALNITKAPGDRLSFLLSRDPSLIPNTTPEEGTSFGFRGLDDGIWYVIARKINCEPKKESCIIRRRIMIDSVPPEEFIPQASDIGNIYDGKLFVSFAAVDKQSGVARYEIRELPWHGNFRTVESPVTLQDQYLGWNITIRAVDAAGNVREATIPHPRQLILASIAALVILSLGLWLVRLMIQLKLKQRR